MGHQALGVMGSIDIRCLREGNIGEGGGLGVGMWWCKGVEKRDVYYKLECFVALLHGTIVYFVCKLEVYILIVKNRLRGGMEGGL